MKLRFLLVLILLTTISSTKLFSTAKPWLTKIGLELGYETANFDYLDYYSKESNCNSDLWSNLFTLGVKYESDFYPSESNFQISSGLKFALYEDSKFVNTINLENPLRKEYLESSSLLYYAKFGGSIRIYKKLVTSGLIELNQSLSDKEEYYLDIQDGASERTKMLETESVFNGFTLGYSIGLEYKYINLELSKSYTMYLAPGVFVGNSYNFKSKTDFINFRFGLSLYLGVYPVSGNSPIMW